VVCLVVVRLAEGERFRVVAIRERGDTPGPLERFLLAQGPGQQAKLFTAIRRFADRGPTYNAEQCKRLKGPAAALVELKVKPARLLGFYCPLNRGVLVLTHGFDKKSRETPMTEVERALDLRKEYLQWLRHGV
jgi:phage-related protein